MSDFTIKDSGERQHFASGMQRDTSSDKIDYTLIRDGVMFKRWAQHMTNGAKKYDKRNWLKAQGEAELARFKESAARHFEEWMNGERDEDHASAIFFNLDGYETLKAKMNQRSQTARSIGGGALSQVGKQVQPGTANKPDWPSQSYWAELRKVAHENLLKQARERQGIKSFNPFEQGL